GLDFPNPLGLAAGFDKDARLTGILPALGFGFVEVGSITLRPQPVNPRPRLFRLPESEALVNRMGFNSRGAAAAAAALAGAPRMVPVGVNLGLNKDCPPERAPGEYAEAFSLLCARGDYFVVNVSSPNTEGLRGLQEKRRLEAILRAIQERNAGRKPVLVKLSPDLSDSQLDDALEAACSQAAGAIAANTTLAKAGLPAAAALAGGLSGRPLFSPSTALIRRIRARCGLPIIGVGGIMSGADALEKIRAGACLVQLYTALVYRGPRAATGVLEELRLGLEKAGFRSVAQAVGSEEASA
ncbi:MAG: quinone-dependent dihydroorotate dehydrogenase, partial [Elusimicrobia bacterium]|nr:quinone-dependent dihydroorotate dehydrogenase [Elusimicrobiota bacterium]